MIRSMTGFGTANFEDATRLVVIEIKSLNSKTQDLSLRFPKAFNDKEIDIRNLVTQALDRGKISVSIDYQRKGEVKPKLTINKELFTAYYRDLKAAAESVGDSNTDLMRAALGLPDVYTSDKISEEPEHDWQIVLETLQKCIAHCDAFRLSEGRILQTKLEEYIHTIGSLLSQISVLDPERIQKIRDKIQSKLRELLNDAEYDRNRFEQELIYYIEKLDITEEKVRLRTHLDYFLEILNKDDANGKKLGFIAQEIGREINTIGSKANDAHIQKWVVQMKEELEKIKEQTLNVL